MTLEPTEAEYQEAWLKSNTKAVYGNLEDPADCFQEGWKAAIEWAETHQQKEEEE